MCVMGDFCSMLAARALTHAFVKADHCFLSRAMETKPNDGLAGACAITAYVAGVRRGAERKNVVRVF